MNAALPYLSHRWFAPSLVVLCTVLGPWMPTDSPLTWLLAGLLFVALGLPHGAVDHITYHHALGRTERSAPWLFVFPYLLGLAAFTALFLVAPTAATWAFLALAAWHFGQSHVEVRTHEVLDRVRGFALGAVLLGTLLGTQQVYGKAKLRIMSQLVSQPTLRAPTPFLFGTHTLKTKLRTTGVTAMGHSGTIAHTLAVDVTAGMRGDKAKKTPRISADQWRSSLSRQRYGWFELKKKMGSMDRTSISDIVFSAPVAQAAPQPGGGAGGWLWPKAPTMMCRRPQRPHRSRHRQ